MTVKAFTNLTSVVFMLSYLVEECYGLLRLVDVNINPGQKIEVPEECYICDTKKWYEILLNYEEVGLIQIKDNQIKGQMSVDDYVLYTNGNSITIEPQ
jgi:hypothetical protein